MRIHVNRDETALAVSVARGEFRIKSQSHQAVIVWFVVKSDEYNRAKVRSTASRVSRGNYARLSPLTEPYVRVRIRLLFQVISSNLGQNSGFDTAEIIES